MVGESAAMRTVHELVRQVARTDATVLLRGESGTGKELVADALHSESLRAGQALVKINCAALPETLVESELFGHEKGAFTGAYTRKQGRFELAHRGTLFLDEVGELSAMTQAKLLRVLASREFERVGGTETLRANVRLVVATNRDMERAVREGTFREDLYYRLNVFMIVIPPLRERREDIPSLSEYFLRRMAERHGRVVDRFSDGALESLIRYPWPGNVRQLENTIERAVVVADGRVIQERHLPDELAARAEAVSEPLGLADAVRRFEQNLIEDALRRARGNRAKAARLLGTTERILGYRVRKLAIDCARFR
jgi:Nif-specific regulatory protein